MGASLMGAFFTSRQAMRGKHISSRHQAGQYITLKTDHNVGLKTASRYVDLLFYFDIFGCIDYSTCPHRC